jgi:hypothetical protein
MDEKPADTSPSEETKRKFREALERKKKGAAGNKREFRRKSG